MQATQILKDKSLAEIVVDPADSAGEGRGRPLHLRRIPPAALTVSSERWWPELLLGGLRPEAAGNWQRRPDPQHRRLGAPDHRGREHTGGGAKP